MSSDDLVVANADGATVRADINANLQALGSLMSGSTAPSTTYAYEYWADTGTGFLRQRNSSNTGWVLRGNISNTLVQTKTYNYTVVTGDKGTTILVDASSGNLTITLLAVATALDGFDLNVVKIDSSANTVTIDGDGSETIDGATTQVLTYQYNGASIRTNATAWYSESGSKAVTSHNNLWEKAQRGNITALTRTATVTPDFADSNSFSIAMDGNITTLANPTNIVALDQSGSIWFVQDGTGSRLLSALGSYWKGAAVTLSTGANVVDRMDYAVRNATKIEYVMSLDTEA